MLARTYRTDFHWGSIQDQWLGSDSDEFGRSENAELPSGTDADHLSPTVTTTTTTTSDEGVALNFNLGLCIHLTLGSWSSTVYR